MAITWHLVLSVNFYILIFYSETTGRNVTVWRDSQHFIYDFRFI